MPFLNRFVSRYLNPIEVDDEFRSLAELFPSLCTLEILPHLTHGYEGVHRAASGRHPMHVMRISSDVGNAQKPAVLLMRSPHAREWVNALAVVETARQLLENYRPSDPDPQVQAIVTTLEKAEIFIVPEGNPDGARYSFFDPGQRLWRKNLRPPPAASGCPGVDCNRNYSRYFAAAGSSGSPCSDVYRGPHAISEPESANVRYIVEQHRNIIFAIDSHSSGQAIFRPNPHGGTYVSSLPVPPVDHVIYSRLEELMNAEIVGVQGVEYRTGTTSNHAGTSDEYFYFDHHIFGFDLECARQFQPPIDEAVNAALEVAAATKALAWCAAGQTDIDVTSLLRRRQELVLADEVVVPDRFAAPWTAADTPPEKWRRFVIRIVQRGPDVKNLALQLVEREFDLTRVDEQGCELIASAEELVELLDVGYEIGVVDDVYRTSMNNGEFD